jgi:glycerol-3-phosphate cytidylyltransferase
MVPEKKYRRGFIAGMFDIFHIGHLDLLCMAKEQCDYLIVAVGTDEFYRKRKQRQPIMPYSERAEIVKAIRYVDEVVEEIDLDKVGAYHKYHFDAMFSGNDHEFEDVYMQAAEELNKIGVDTIYMTRRGITSTILRRNFKVEHNGNV